jgi:dolichol-phosphate mannosyltransferase
MISTLVIIPTYNEADSIEGVIARVLHLDLPDYKIDVLVVDDGSPDGTAVLVKDLKLQRVHLLARMKKAGLGKAYLAGFDWGLARDYQLFVEMDGDGSHLPEQLHRLLEANSAGADLAIGSRWIPGGKVDNWSLLRQLLSKAGNRYARFALGFGLHDATAGYRAYTREALAKLDLSSVDSNGYCFQIDLAWRAWQRELKIVEVPITFVERIAGVSKMSKGIVLEAVWQITKWGVLRVTAQRR